MSEQCSTHLTQRPERFMQAFAFSSPCIAVHGTQHTKAPKQRGRTYGELSQIGRDPTALIRKHSGEMRRRSSSAPARGTRYTVHNTIRFPFVTSVYNVDCYQRQPEDCSLSIRHSGIWNIIEVRCVRFSFAPTQSTQVRAYAVCSPHKVGQDRSKPNVPI